MRAARRALLAALFALSALPSFSMQAPAPLRAGVTLIPGEVLAGSPELIRVDAPDATSVDGTWLGRRLAFFRGRNGWLALGGVDVEAPAGPSRIELHLRYPSGAVRDLTRTVEVGEGHYRTGVLTVPPRFVTPGAAELALIRVDAALKSKIFAVSAPGPLWRGSFVRPVEAEPTDSFGTRRTFNGRLASVHKGMDFRAAPGTVVLAANSGTVVLARPLYYEGSCVVIDHGLGLYTISMHLSRIDVREGQQVTGGQPIGLSGATGRVTGPHLHWAVRWQGAYLDPARLLTLDLNAIP